MIIFNYLSKIQPTGKNKNYINLFKFYLNTNKIIRTLISCNLNKKMIKDHCIVLQSKATISAILVISYISIDFSMLDITNIYNYIGS